MKVQSTFIKEVKLEDFNDVKILTIIFNNGYTAYYNVDSYFNFNEFINSESIGSYYHKHIKGQLTTYTTDEYNFIKEEFEKQQNLNKELNDLTAEEKLSYLRKEEEYLLNEFLKIKAEYEEKLTSIAIKKEELISLSVKEKLNS